MLKLIFTILLFTHVAIAQEFTGNINGRVTDSSGALVPGVTITLTSPAIQGARETISGEAGAYQFRLLPPGTYTVKYALAGFKTLIREGVIVEVLKTVTLDIAIEVATQAETVTVTGETPVVDTQIGREFLSDVEAVEHASREEIPVAGASLG